MAEVKYFEDRYKEIYQFSRHEEDFIKRIDEMLTMFLHMSKSNNVFSDIEEQLSTARRERLVNARFNREIITLTMAILDIVKDTFHPKTKEEKQIEAFRQLIKIREVTGIDLKLCEQKILNDLEDNRTLCKQKAR